VPAAHSTQPKSVFSTQRLILCGGNNPYLFTIYVLHIRKYSMWRSVEYLMQQCLVHTT